MQTNLLASLLATREGREADEILRKCVHCGFCTATCPTYQVTGDELDGPRGRIYLIKQVLEGKMPTEATQTHLDRCLTCRNCESTCPSGVHYSRLLDIGRHIVEQRVGRSPAQQLLRKTLQTGLTRQWLFRPAYRTGMLLRPLLPAGLRNKLRPAAAPQTGSAQALRTHQRTMLLLDGCVQPVMSPEINAAAARLLDKLGVQLVTAPKAGCCGAIHHHLNATEAALQDMRNNIDAWWPQIEAGAEAIVMTASGCGVTVRDYGYMLQDDPAYAAKARQVSALCKDISEVLEGFADDLSKLAPAAADQEKIMFHPPCTLQHGQKIRGKVERLLAQHGIQVSLCADSHLCCGSAGTYSILQSSLAQTLRDRKLNALQATTPDRIVSANIGCIAHLQSGTETPVEHWIVLLERRLSAAASAV